MVQPSGAGPSVGPERDAEEGWSQDRHREQAEDFAEARRQHAGVESAINNLNQRGLSLIRTHGEEGFVRTVALVVVAANVHRLGLVLKQKKSDEGGSTKPDLERRRSTFKLHQLNVTMALRRVSLPR